MRTKWFVYTVIVGLVPAATRLLIYLLAKNVSAELMIDEADLIAFGLVLNISNINVLEHEKHADRNWKTRAVGLSIVLIIFFAVLFALSCITRITPSVVNSTRLKQASGVLAFAAFVFSYSIYDRLAKLKPIKGRGE